MSTKAGQYQVLGSEHYVTERLRASVDWYEWLIGEPGVRNYDGVLPLEDILAQCRVLGDRIRVGHQDGEADLVARPLVYLEDKPWKWRDPCTNAGAVIPRNWIPGALFAALIHRRRAEAAEPPLTLEAEAR